MPQNKSTRRALGRGLSSLIPVDSKAYVSDDGDNQIISVELDAIKPNPFQPRLHFNEEEITELAESIKTQGLLQPVLLRKTPLGYEIISGERRVRAVRRIGHSTIPAIIRGNVTDKEMLEIALVENLQREELDPISCARGYERLLKDCGLSHEQLSQRLGKSRSSITNTLRILKLPAEVQEMVKTGQISAGHARALAGLDDAQQQKMLACAIVNNGLSVRAIEEKIKKITKQQKVVHPEATAASERDPNIESLVERLRYRLGTAVAIKLKSEGKGSVIIQFVSISDLNRIARLIIGP